MASCQLSTRTGPKSQVTHDDEAQGQPLEGIRVDFGIGRIPPDRVEEGVVFPHERRAVHFVPRPATRGQRHALCKSKYRRSPLNVSEVQLDQTIRHPPPRNSRDQPLQMILGDPALLERGDDLLQLRILLDAQTDEPTLSEPPAKARTTGRGRVADIRGELAGRRRFVRHGLL